jgi:hypothetical protein
VTKRILRESDITSSDNGQSDLDFPHGANADAKPEVPEQPQAEPASAAEAAPDPFDPARLRVSADPSVASGVRKVLLAVPVGKPDKSQFIRTHGAEEYRGTFGLIEIKGDRQIYLVDKPLHDALRVEATYVEKLLVTSINRQGDLFLWPVSMREDQWGQTARDAADRARTRWVRVVANMSGGYYDLLEASANLSEPVWPQLTFGEILRLAFRGALIDTLDHPVVRRLREGA